MKVILQKDIDNLGKKNDIKDVNSGFARNFLLKRGLAKLATEKNVKVAEEIQSSELEQSSKDLEKAGEMASKMEGIEVEMKVKVGDKGQLFEKISQQKIAQSLEDMGYKIKKDQIILAKDIKEIGEYDVKIKFEHNLETQIKVIITGQ